MKKFIFGIMFAVMACVGFGSCCGNCGEKAADTDTTAVDSTEVVVDSIAVEEPVVEADSVTEVAE